MHRIKKPVCQDLFLLRAHQLQIVEAKVYTTLHGYALDTFQVMDPCAPPHITETLSHTSSTNY
jgi:UTP:GlnB (protein PII) uridylyltransferase